MDELEVIRLTLSHPISIPDNMVGNDMHIEIMHSSRVVLKRSLSLVTRAPPTIDPTPAAKPLTKPVQMENISKVLKHSRISLN